MNEEASEGDRATYRRRRRRRLRRRRKVYSKKGEQNVSGVGGDFSSEEKQRETVCSVGEMGVHAGKGTVVDRYRIITSLLWRCLMSASQHCCVRCWCVGRVSPEAFCAGPRIMVYLIWVTRQVAYPPIQLSLLSSSPSSRSPDQVIKYR